MSTVSSLISGGIGAGVTAIVVALIQQVGRRGESRAQAADLITHAATEMVDRLTVDNRELRTAILLLTDVLDYALPHIDAPPDVLEKLRDAKRAAQKAI